MGYYIKNDISVREFFRITNARFILAFISRLLIRKKRKDPQSQNSIPRIEEKSVKKSDHRGDRRKVSRDRSLDRTSSAFPQYQPRPRNKKRKEEAKKLRIWKKVRHRDSPRLSPAAGVAAVSELVIRVFDAPR